MSSEKLLLLVAAICLSIVTSTAIPRDYSCVQVCATSRTSDGIELMKYLCGCSSERTVDIPVVVVATAMPLPAATTPAAIATIKAATPTTTDICDHLCAMQMGGDACECNFPALPGKKK